MSLSLEEYKEVRAKCEEIRTFHEAVQNRDWFHEMSDDHRVYKRGQKEMEEISNRIDTPFEYEKQRVWDYFTAYHYRGGSFSGVKPSKPFAPWNHNHCFECCGTGINIDETHEDGAYKVCPVCKGRGNI